MTEVNPPTRSGPPTPDGCTVVPPGGGASYWVVGDLVTFKVGPDQTGGRYSFAETTVGPGGGPPPHVHTREDETFYVLDGDFAFVLGHRLYTGSKGSVVHLPKNVPHTFKNVGPGPGRLLVAATPCGFESFIPLAGCPCTDPSAPAPPVDQAAIDRLMAACPQYGVRMLFDHKPAGGPAPLPDRGRRLWVRGIGDEQVHVRLTGADTGGAFTVSEITSRPGNGVPHHRHNGGDEVFYVLDGTYEFVLGAGSDSRTVTALPGSVVHVPRGAYFAVRNVGDGPGRVLNYHAPAGLEAFFEEVGRPCPDPAAPPPTETRDEGQLWAIFDRHGMETPAK